MNKSWPIINLKRVDSTNDYAHLLINNNELMDDTVINAHCQLVGRGQEGNIWESDAGKNLTFTLVHFINYLTIEKQFYLAKAISLAIVDFLKSHNIEAMIKWPNDIYAGNKKIAGILIENSILNEALIYSLIGIGLNVNQQYFSNELSNVQSMRNLTSRNYELSELLDQLLTYIKIQLEKLSTHEFTLLDKEYLEKLYLFEQKSLFSTKGKKFYGKIIGVEESGRLIILSDEGMKLSFMFKEVKILN